MRHSKRARTSPWPCSTVGKFTHSLVTWRKKKHHKHRPKLVGVSRSKCSPSTHIRHLTLLFLVSWNVATLPTKGKEFTVLSRLTAGKGPNHTRTGVAQSWSKPLPTIMLFFLLLPTAVAIYFLALVSTKQGLPSIFPLGLFPWRKMQWPRGISELHGRDSWSFSAQPAVPFFCL